MEHFASISYLTYDIGAGDFINSAVKVSDLMNKINLIEKTNEPGKIHNSDDILKYPGLISNDFGEKRKIIYISITIKNFVSKRNKCSHTENLTGSPLLHFFLIINTFMYYIFPKTFFYCLFI